MFTAEDMIQILNFFFNKIIKSDSIFHLFSLITYYSSHSEGKSDKDLSMRAECLTINDKFRLKIIYKFFKKVTQQQLLISNNLTLFKMLCQNIINMNVLNHLNCIMRLIQDKNEEICQYLNSINEKSDIRKSYTSCLINYLCHFLGLSKNAFNALIQSTQASYILMIEFKSEVFCLLFKNTAIK